jgi:hypothetical protein
MRHEASGDPTLQFAPGPVDASAQLVVTHRQLRVIRADAPALLERLGRWGVIAGC